MADPSHYRTIQNRRYIFFFVEILIAVFWKNKNSEVFENNTNRSCPNLERKRKQILNDKNNKPVKCKGEEDNPRVVIGEPM